MYINNESKNTAESQTYYAKWKKPNRKGYVLRRTEELLSDIRVGARGQLQRSTRSFISRRWRKKDNQSANQSMGEHCLKERQESSGWEDQSSANWDKWREGHSFPGHTRVNFQGVGGGNLKSKSERKISKEQNLPVSSIKSPEGSGPKNRNESETGQHSLKVRSQLSPHCVEMISSPIVSAQQGDGETFTWNLCDILYT